MAFPSFLSLKQLGLKFVKGLIRRIYDMNIMIHTPMPDLQPSGYSLRAKCYWRNRLWPYHWRI